MADKMSNTGKPIEFNLNTLVLSDQAGNVYVIPVATLQSHLVLGEQKAQIEKLLGDDVSGYGGQMEAPKFEAPKFEAPKFEAPKFEAPTLSGMFVFLPDMETRDY